MELNGGRRLKSPTHTHPHNHPTRTTAPPEIRCASLDGADSVAQLQRSALRHETAPLERETFC